MNSDNSDTGNSSSNNTTNNIKLNMKKNFNSQKSIWGFIKVRLNIIQK